MIPGLKYIADFVSEQEQKDLIQIIDSLPWDKSLTRRVQQYGYKYDYTKKTIDSSLYLGALPEWLSPYIQRLLDQKLFIESPDQVIINEYLPGQGISRHLDCVPCFGDTIASISLSSPCMMEFEQVGLGKKGSMMLGPMSLLVLSEEARYQWMHSIPARKTDKFGDEVIERGRRISLTFRNVIKKH